MVLVENLKILCETERIEPIAPSWCIVNYLLLKNKNEYNVSLGAVVAASGECSIFSFNRKSIEPMYFNTIGGSDRLKIITGYNTVGIQTTDTEVAFQFIKKGIDDGKGIFISGPEIAVCYGYHDNPDRNKRKVMGFTRWGPGLNGTVPWELFTQFIQMFGKNEGLAYITGIYEPVNSIEIVKLVTEQVIDWQKDHPAVAFGQKQDYYGIDSFQKYINDISDPVVRETIDEAYINCHAIEFQFGGRYWLGTYLKDLAKEFTMDLSRALFKAGNLYLKSHLKLKQFYEYNILDNKTKKEITLAIDWLKEALIIEEMIMKQFIIIRELIKNKQ